MESGGRTSRLLIDARSGGSLRNAVAKGKKRKENWHGTDPQPSNNTTATTSRIHSDLSSSWSGARQRPVEDAACGRHDEQRRKQRGALWVGRGAWKSETITKFDMTACCQNKRTSKGGQQ